jgi:serine/threonine-protein kinase RsbW
MMGSDPAPLTLTIPSDLRMLSVARSFVDAACQLGALDKHTMNAIVLASSEAITNIIRHAHRNRPGAHLQLQMRLLPGLVEILLYDQGDPFDIAAVPELDPTELRLGGRGVYLMRALMDDLSTQPREGRGNVLRMIKRIPHAGGEAVSKVS